jgi:hypothetical protein
MKHFAILMLLATQMVHAVEGDTDLATLLHRISVICGDRWEMDLADGDQIRIYSKQEALGEGPGLNFGPGEDYYRLGIRFKVVQPIDGKSAARKREQLSVLVEQAKTIPYRYQPGEHIYYPKNEKEWALVVAIRKAQREVGDFPEYRFKSVHLSESMYSMSSWVPNKTNRVALQYKKDIVEIYKLFEEVTLEKPRAANDSLASPFVAKGG